METIGIDIGRVLIEGDGPDTSFLGHDEERGEELRAIEFHRIKGGKPFDLSLPWFGDLLSGIGQPHAAPAPAH